MNVRYGSDSVPFNLQKFYLYIIVLSAIVSIGCSKMSLRKRELKD